MKYLQKYEEYFKRYDELTIMECKRWDNSMDEVESKIPQEHSSQEDRNEALRAITMARSIQLIAIQGERIENKEKTIEEWMKRDKDLDDKLENAVAPENIRCKKCGVLMKSDFKHLTNSYKNIEFIYRCTDCKTGRFILDNRKERIIEKRSCPKCSGELIEKHRKTKKNLTTMYSCKKCDFSDKEIIEFSIAKKPTIKEINEFERDREKYCNDKALEDYNSMKRAVATLKMIEEEQGKKNKYEAVLSKIKTLSVPQLEKHLIKPFEKNDFQKLHLADPQDGQYLSISFSVQDYKEGRCEYDSKKDFKQLLQKVLFNTNWILAPKQVSYRLGVLRATIRAIEGENNIIEMIEKRKKS